MVRDGKSSEFRPVLQYFPTVQILANLRHFLFFRWKCAIFHLFLSLHAFQWPAIISSRSCAGFDGVSAFSHVWRGGSHWFRPRKSWRKKVMAKTLRKGLKIMERGLFWLQVANQSTGKVWKVHFWCHFIGTKFLDPYVPKNQSKILFLVQILTFSPIFSSKKW